LTIETFLTQNVTISLSTKTIVP